MQRQERVQPMEPDMGARSVEIRMQERPEAVANREVPT